MEALLPHYIIQNSHTHASLISAGGQGQVTVKLLFYPPYDQFIFSRKWTREKQHIEEQFEKHKDDKDAKEYLVSFLQSFRLFSLHAPSIAEPVKLDRYITLGNDGSQLAGVLDNMRDKHPEQFEALNQEVARWLPEFDRILFDTLTDGYRSFLLRQRSGGFPIKASALSQGTLLALAILTVAYLPDPPSIVCFEEPDRGLHPRLLRNVKDALYRLSYPDSFGETRPPVQVIATTHSPYMLDLFRDNIDEIVIAQKQEDNVLFQRLSEMPNIHEILEGSHLGEVWYTGVLGGTPD